MQIKYLSQEHQTKAINRTLDLFLGQAKLDSEYDIFNGEAVCSNILTIQKANGVEKNDKLETLDFIIEMETETGKTYVYIKTILAMYAKYGWNKFIIITPSIAIREGVLNSLKSMKEHFKSEFNFPYDYFEYDSQCLSSLKHFIRNDTLNIMVIP